MEVCSCFEPSLSNLLMEVCVLISNHLLSLSAYFKPPLKPPRGGLSAYFKPPLKPPHGGLFFFKLPLPKLLLILLMKIRLSNHLLNLLMEVTCSSFKPPLKPPHGGQLSNLSNLMEVLLSNFLDVSPFKPTVKPPQGGLFFFQTSS